MLASDHATKARSRKGLVRAQGLFIPQSDFLDAMKGRPACLAR
jgi:hypothetical protein